MQIYYRRRTFFLLASSFIICFGLIFFTVFFVISFWNFRGEFSQIKTIPLYISLFFLILGLLNSKILTPLKKIWIKFGELMGKIVSPVVMAIVYFVVITPMAVIIRLLGKDLLKIKFEKVSSYWINRRKKVGSMKKQF